MFARCSSCTLWHRSCSGYRLLLSTIFVSPNFLVAHLCSATDLVILCTYSYPHLRLLWSSHRSEGVRLQTFLALRESSLSCLVGIHALHMLTCISLFWISSSHSPSFSSVSSYTSVPLDPNLSKSMSSLEANKLRRRPRTERRSLARTMLRV